jgi:hypothetical protein
VQGIEPTATYGIRVYYKNSTLETHVDRVETHVLSVVYCVDAAYPDPSTPVWKIEADPDLQGVHSEAEVKPGQIFFFCLPSTNTTSTGEARADLLLRECQASARPPHHPAGRLLRAHLRALPAQGLELSKC